MIAPLKYRPEIDGMRAISVLLVLIFHFSLLSVIRAGFLGVDIFFVISGFLITTILKNQLDAGTFTFRAFYINRIRRLAPALFVVLLVVMSAGVLWLFPDELVELSKQSLVSQFYVANIYYWRSISYFGLGAHNVFLLHTWSLGVEEQFYLLYPAFLWLLHRRFQKHFWSMLALACLSSFVINIAFMNQKPEAAFYLLPTRSWELLIGALVPLVATKWEARSKCMDEIIGVCGVSLIAIGVLCYRADFRIPGFYALLPGVGAACLLLCSQSRTTTVSKCLSWSPIVYIGKISYSLYLIHWPLHVFGEHLIKNYTSGWRFAMFLLSILLGALIYHAVELPIHRKCILSANSKLLPAYVMGLATTVSLFLAVFISNGLPHRFPDKVIDLANYVSDRSEPLEECEFRGQTLSNPKSFCQIGTLDRDPTWLVYGDSHAWATHAVFDKWLKLKGQAGLFIFRHSCPPLNGVHVFRDYGDLCFRFNAAITHYLEQNYNIQNIVLVSIWREAIEGELSASPQVLASKAESVKLFTEQFSQTLEHLHSLGRHVYVWEPVPGARQSVPRELARATLENRRPADIDFSFAEYLSEYRFFFDALRENRKLIDGSFSPSQVLCKTGKCAVSNAGRPLYADDNHITKSTVDFWVQILQNPVSGN